MQVGSSLAKSFEICFYSMAEWNKWKKKTKQTYCYFLSGLLLQVNWKDFCFAKKSLGKIFLYIFSKDKWNCGIKTTTIKIFLSYESLKENISAWVVELYVLQNLWMTWIYLIFLFLMSEFSESLAISRFRLRSSTIASIYLAVQVF